MRWIVLITVVTCAHSQLAWSENSTIYKCTSATGAVSFSAKPCAGTTQIKKITPARTVLADEPVLPGNIPGKGGRISPEPQLDTAPRRTPLPPVTKDCRSEAYNIKRELDRQFTDLNAAIKADSALLEQNSRDLSQAQSSKVGVQWGIMLTDERRIIEARLRTANAALVEFYPQEKAKFDEIGVRCKDAGTK
jgi:hypothetical protein